MSTFNLKHAILNPVGLFVLFNILFIFPGVIVIWFLSNSPQFDLLYLSHDYSSPKPIVDFGLLLLVTLLGAYAANVVLKKSTSFAWPLSIQKLQNGVLPPACTLSVVTTFYMVVMMVVISLYSLYGAPILSADPTQAYQQLMASNYRPWVTLFNQFLFPIFVLTLITLRVKEKRYWLLLVLGSMVVALMSRRYPLIDTLLMAVVAWFLMRNRIRFKMLMMAILAVVIVMAGIAYTRHPSFELSQLAWDVIRRLSISEGFSIHLAGQVDQPQYHGLSPYIDHLRYLILRDDMPTLLGTYFFDLRFMGTSHVGQGYLPPTLFGELLTAFGMASLLIMFVVAYCLQAIYIKWSRSQSGTITYIIFMTVLIVYSGRMAVLGLVPFINNMIYFMAVLGVILVVIQFFNRHDAITPMATRVARVNEEVDADV